MSAEVLPVNTEAYPARGSTSISLAQYVVYATDFMGKAAHLRV